jgi:dTDP-glucose 4,6-dehydratase
MKKKFLVIGSNSFSGAYFVKYLLENDHEVLGVSRSTEPVDVMLPYKWLPGSDNFSFHQIDLNHQLEELLTLVKDFQPEFVVNFAAQGMVAQSWESPQDWYLTNVVAQVRLHDRLRKLPFLEKYVHVSTPEVYGSTEGWIKESFQFAPSTPYAVSRAACDLHLMSFFRAYQFPVCFTRAANVYGPGQQLYRIIPRTMLYARLRKQMHLHGGGRSVRSFIHMRDVADATYRVALRGVPGDSYHISTPDPISVRALVEKICRMTDTLIQDLVVISEDRLGKDQAYLLESSKIRSELNWSHQITLDAGLQETLAWVDTHLDSLKELPADYIHKL